MPICPRTHRSNLPYILSTWPLDFLPIIIDVTTIISLTLKSVLLSRVHCETTLDGPSLAKNDNTTNDCEDDDLGGGYANYICSEFCALFGWI